MADAPEASDVPEYGDGDDIEAFAIPWNVEEHQAPRRWIWGLLFTVVTWGGLALSVGAAWVLSG